MHLQQETLVVSKFIILVDTGSFTHLLLKLTAFLQRFIFKNVFLFSPCCLLVSLIWLNVVSFLLLNLFAPKSKMYTDEETSEKLPTFYVWT